jgi:hypothetical protein
MDTKEIVKSRNFKLAIGVVGVLLVALVSFAGGVVVGLHKAKFSYDWGKNYERNFMGASFKDSGMNTGDNLDGKTNSRKAMLDFPRNIEGRDFRNAHGLAGTIISITDSNIIVKDRDNKESTVAVTDETIIKDHMEDVKITDLKTDDQIVVMGKPNDGGTIEADLIRIFCCNSAGEENNSNNN